MEKCNADLSMVKIHKKNDRTFYANHKGKKMLENDLLNLTHEQQQLAVEKIQELMSQGMGSGEAIALVAKQLREQKTQKQNKNE